MNKTFAEARLEFETRTGPDPRQEAFNPDGMDHMGFYHDPVEGFRVNPETALHAGEHLAVSIRRWAMASWQCPKVLDWKTT